MSQQFNPVVAHPDLSDVINLYIQKAMIELNCHAIGTVQIVNTTALTLSATINYSRSYTTIDQSTGVYTQTQKPYPMLSDVPFVIMGGGNSSLTFPISQGDQALILFNDRDMDNWFMGARTGNVNSNRVHHLSDGLAIVGLLPKLPTAYSVTHAILQNGLTVVGVSSSKVLVNNSIGKTLNTILQNLITSIENLTVNPGSFQAGGNPVTGSGTVSSSGTPDLAQVATDLGNLLE
jgi:Phage protein Gp138 N-terminal domain